jgi:hypothetical protein
MLVKTVEDDIRRAADAPARSLDTVGDIQHFRVRSREPNIEELQQRMPVPLGLFVGTAQQSIQIGKTVPAQKRSHSGLLRSIRG